MKNEKVEIGKTYGRWLVIDSSSIKKGKAKSWFCECQCEAKTRRLVTQSGLLSGSSRSCGCINKEISANKIIDLRGKTFGRLTVLENFIRKSHAIYWECQCSCEKKTVKYVKGESLRSGKTQSCGCLNRELSTLKNTIDLTGQLFGRLLVLEQVERPAKYKNKSTYWLCECQCENKTLKIVIQSALRNGTTRSCGCLTREVQRKRLSKQDGEASFNTVFGSYINSAKVRGLCFELTKDDFRKITRSNCYYCNRIPETIQKNKNNCGDYIYNGIDRLDNDEGYTLDNSVPCCIDCNISKFTRTEEEFIEWIEKVYSNLLKKGKIKN
jgi:hypothetical protein